MATEEGTMRSLPDDVQAWAEALEAYEEFQDNIKLASRLYRSFPVDAATPNPVLYLASYWFDHRYPKIWAEPHGVFRAVMVIGVAGAIRDGTWEIFLDALEEGWQKKEEQAAELGEVDDSGNYPAIRKLYVPFGLQVYAWATKESFLEAMAVQYDAVVEPALTRKRYEPAKKKGAGQSKNYLGHVNLFNAFLTFCASEKRHPDPEHKETRAAFCSACSRKHNAVDVSSIWFNVKPQRTTVEDMFEGAKTWLPPRLGVPGLEDYLARCTAGGFDLRGSADSQACSDLRTVV